VVNHTINVKVTLNTGVESLADSNCRISSDGRIVTVAGYNGSTFDLVNTQGITVDTFTVDSEKFTYTLTVAPGIYILIADNGVSKKIIVK
ncbi:MAG: T9SS type A sorting domain-containing protein, partial [Muribaculaceae bacterium]|nr:T9SS type A sorting domain-containing protein [Muribaculaceae bacterium]